MDNKSANEPLPQANQPSSQPSGEINVKPSSRLVVLLLALFGVLLLLGATIVLASRSIFQPRPPVQVVTPKPTQTLPSDPTAGWKTYSLKTIGLEFKLPPAFNSYGEMKEEIKPGEKGTQLCMTFAKKTSFLLVKPVFAGGSFCDINYFGFGTVSPDYEAGRGGGFTDLLGFTFENGKYYARQNLNRKFEIPADLVKEVKSQYGVQVLRIIGKNSTTGEWQGPIAGTPGDGKIGALVNTTNNTYPGIAIEMELGGNLTGEVFDQILSTFKFTDQTNRTQVSPIPNGTVNWKIYNNSTYLYSFKYPANIDVKENSSGYVTLTRKKDPKNLDLVILFFSSANPEGLSRRNFFAKQGNSTIEQIGKYLNIQDVSLGQIDALRIIQDKDYYKNQSTPYTNYVIAHGNVIYTIATQEFSGYFNGTATEIQSNNADSTTTNQILSTFKFTN